MKINRPTVEVLLDTRRMKKSGLYPVKLRVTFLRQQQYYPINTDLSEDDFLSVKQFPALSKSGDAQTKRKFKELRLRFDAANVKAEDIISKMGDFSFRQFEKALYNGQQTAKGVYELYKVTIIDFKRREQLGTASNYECSMKSLQNFSPKLEFRDVTVDFLKDYEKWLIDNGRSISTVGIYLRPLRAVFNSAIDHGFVIKESYPFGKKRYQMPSPRNKKKALTKVEIRMIMEYPALQNTWWDKARDFFIFSYLGNGMNLKDIALLKHNSIDGDYIRFVRAKTQFTNRNASMPISIFITKELKCLIEKWKTSDNDPNNYLLPILTSNLSPERARAVLQQFIKMVNTYLKAIAKELKIDKPITTYYARHSFATILRRSGASTEMISESLGHQNIKTTSSYLDGFENDTKMKLALELTNFAE